MLKCVKYDRFQCCCATETKSRDNTLTFVSLVWIEAAEQIRHVSNLAGVPSRDVTVVVQDILAIGHSGVAVVYSVATAPMVCRL